MFTSAMGGPTSILHLWLLTVQIPSVHWWIGTRIGSSAANEYVPVFSTTLLSRPAARPQMPGSSPSNASHHRPHTTLPPNTLWAAVQSSLPVTAGSGGSGAHSPPPLGGHALLRGPLQLQFLRSHDSTPSPAALPRPLPPASCPNLHLSIPPLYATQAGDGLLQSPQAPCSPSPLSCPLPCVSSPAPSRNCRSNGEAAAATPPVCRMAPQPLVSSPTYNSSPEHQQQQQQQQQQRQQPLVQAAHSVAPCSPGVHTAAPACTLLRPAHSACDEAGVQPPFTGQPVVRAPELKGSVPGSPAPPLQAAVPALFSRLRLGRLRSRMHQRKAPRAEGGPEPMPQHDAPLCKRSSAPGTLRTGSLLRLLLLSRGSPSPAAPTLPGTCMPTVKPELLRGASPPLRPQFNPPSCQEDALAPLPRMPSGLQAAPPAPAVQLQVGSSAGADAGRACCRRCWCCRCC